MREDRSQLNKKLCSIKSYKDRVQSVSIYESVRSTVAFRCIFKTVIPTSNSISNGLPPNIDQACQCLRQVDCLNPLAAVDQTLLRQALLTVTQASDYQILGICADTFTQGMQALESYAAALEYAPTLNLPVIEGAVYIKFNPKSGLCYASAYGGEHRGVLVSCQSADETGVNEMFGHLPLGLFMK